MIKLILGGTTLTVSDALHLGSHYKQAKEDSK